MDFNRSNRGNCPCRTCPDKGCGARHSTCEAYIAWRKKLDERNEKERTFHKNNDTMSHDHKRKVWRGKRYSRQVRYNKSTNAD